MAKSQSFLLSLQAGTCCLTATTVNMAELHHAVTRQLDSKLLSLRPSLHGYLQQQSA